MPDHVKSINSVTATVHEVTVKNGLLTDVRYYLLSDYLLIKVSKPFYTVTQYCPWKSEHNPSANPTMTVVDITI